MNSNHPARSRVYDAMDAVVLVNEERMERVKFLSCVSDGLEIGGGGNGMRPSIMIVGHPCGVFGDLPDLVSWASSVDFPGAGVTLLCYGTCCIHITVTDQRHANAIGFI